MNVTEYPKESASKPPNNGARMVAGEMSVFAIPT